MKNRLQSKIEATDISISSLLKDQKFYIDYFQREYRWKEKHVKLLIEDLTTTFLKSYKVGHRRPNVANYQSYYLGPVVFSINTNDGKQSIIDGQQRITSITLLLIYLNHLQAERPSKVNISDLIFSESYGEKSFNMTDESREPCLSSLFEIGNYVLDENRDDETVSNMLDRYIDIEQCFPEELLKDALPFFIDWFTQKVVLVKITTYSDENAYTIFETMNDRGLNLTPAEMLKGFVLSKISDISKRTEIDTIWKSKIKELHQYNDSAEQTFFQAWFRGKYSKSIRPGKVGSENKDFEIIGTRFHNWFKDNHRKLFGLKTSEDFYNFFRNDFQFYIDLYKTILETKFSYNKEIPHLNYINYWGIAESLQEPLLLSSILVDDDQKTVKIKMDAVSRFIETFTVKRSLNYKKFGQTTIKYTMFNLMKQIRDNPIDDLGKNLVNELDNMDQTWEGVWDFGLHGQNRKFVKHLLSRISSYLDNQIGKTNNYCDYHHPEGKQFEIEHIWGNKFDEHRDEFDQMTDFQEYRNSIGALILLPNGTNQSFNSDEYSIKLEHYVKENTYAQTLHPKFYERNPNFLNSDKISELLFKPHTDFKKVDIEERLKLVQRICEQIWNSEHLLKNTI